MLRLHDKVMSIGYLRSLDNLIHRGIRHTEGDIIIEGVIEKDGLLIDIAYKSTKVMDTHITNVFAINEYLT